MARRFAEVGLFDAAHTLARQIALLALALTCLGARQRPNERALATPAQPPAQAPRPDEARGYSVRPGTEPEDVVLFVPRLVLAVPRYAIKAVFFPVTQLVAYLDREAVVERVVDVLYNDERTAAVVPKLSVATFFGPTLGVKAFHDNLAGHGRRGATTWCLAAASSRRISSPSELLALAAPTCGSRAWRASRSSLRCSSRGLVTRRPEPPGWVWIRVKQPSRAASGSNDCFRCGGWVTRSGLRGHALKLA